jgi:hypothetical protein
MSAMDELIKAVNEKSNVTYRTSKEELVAYYQKQYPGTGKGGWKQHLVADLAKQTGMKPKNLERRFDPSRLHSQEKRNAGQYKKLGEQLPPVSRSPKGGSITITVKGQQNNGRGGKRERTITGTISGSDAYSFVNNPNWSDFWDLIDWGYPFDMDEDSEYGLDNVTVS